jgi:hypothetical protein
MNPPPNTYGYIQVALHREGGGRGIRPKWSYVHRVVAEAFIGPSNGLHVNHINAIKTDNRVENLEYVTNAENMAHAMMMGLRNGVTGERHPMFGKYGKLSARSKPVEAFVDGDWVRFDGQREASRMLGVNQSSISAAARGRLAMAGGYKWRLAQ